MENKTSEDMAMQLLHMIHQQFGMRAVNFYLYNVDTIKYRQTFSIDFKAYDYFWVGIDFDRGKIVPCIREGKRDIAIRCSETSWDKIDFPTWLEEINQELLIRIPDKFLKAKGFA